MGNVRFDRIEIIDNDTGSNFYISTTNSEDVEVPPVAIGGSGSVALTRNDAIRITNLLLRFIQEVPDREEKDEAPEKDAEKVVSMARWLQSRDNGHGHSDDQPPAI